MNRKTKKVHEIKGPDLRGESQDSWHRRPDWTVSYGTTS